MTLLENDDKTATLLECNSGVRMSKEWHFRIYLFRRTAILKKLLRRTGARIAFGISGTDPGSKT